MGRVSSARPDLFCHGIDLDPDFIAHAKRLYPKVSFEVADAAAWQGKRDYDVVLCTAGLHHLRYEDQERFIQKVAGLLKPGGFAIFGDPYIGDYDDEKSRKLAGAELGYEYLKATIKSGGTDDVVKAAIDVLLVEFKSSVAKIKPLFEKYFVSVEQRKTWPDHQTDYGDYWFLLK